jgi:hypothetical protein
MTYKFIGDGAGIPGLPHMISQVEIDQLSPGLKQSFEDALAAGAYAEAEEPSEQPRKPKSKKSDTPAGVIADEGA